MTERYFPRSLPELRWRYWGRWGKPTPLVVQYMARRLGITEVDVRDMRLYFNVDAIQVRAWNHRKFRVPMIDLYQFGIE